MRQQQVTDRSYQLRFAGRALLLVFALVVVSLIIPSFMMWKMHEPGLASKSTFLGSFLTIVAIVFMELVVALPVVYFLSIQQSHRIVGPINRIIRTLEAIGKRDFSQRITLRESDVLEQVATAINQMAENLKQRSPRPPAS